MRHYYTFLLSIFICVFFPSILKAQVLQNYEGTTIWTHLKSNSMDLLRQDLQSVLNTCASQYTTASYQYATALLWSAMILEEAGDNKQSCSILEKSDKLFLHYGIGPFQGRDTLSEIFRLDLLSALEYNADRDFMSIKYSRQSSVLKGKYFGAKDAIYLNALLDLSRLYAERLHYTKSCVVHNKAYEAYIELIKQNFCSMCESERDSYWKKANQYFERTLWLAYTSSKHIHGSHDSSLAGATYNTLLLSKGLLLNTSVDFENYIEHSNIPQALDLLQQRREYKAIGKEQLTIDSLDYLILRTLKESNKSYYIPKLGAKWQDVAAHLTLGDVAIEFFRTYMNDYGAVVIKKEWKYPKIIRLGNLLSFENKLISRCL